MIAAITGGDRGSVISGAWIDYCFGRTYALQCSSAGLISHRHVYSIAVVTYGGAGDFTGSTICFLKYSCRWRGFEYVSSVAYRSFIRANISVARLGSMIVSSRSFSPRSSVLTLWVNLPRQSHWMIRRAVRVKLGGIAIETLSSWWTFAISD